MWVGADHGERELEQLGGGVGIAAQVDRELVVVAVEERGGALLLLVLGGDLREDLRQELRVALLVVLDRDGVGLDRGDQQLHRVQHDAGLGLLPLARRRRLVLLHLLRVRRLVRPRLLLLQILILDGGLLRRLVLLLLLLRSRRLVGGRLLGAVDPLLNLSARLLAAAVAAA